MVSFKYEINDRLCSVVLEVSFVLGPLEIWHLQIKHASPKNSTGNWVPHSPSSWQWSIWFCLPCYRFQTIGRHSKQGQNESTNKWTRHTSLRGRLSKMTKKGMKTLSWEVIIKSDLYFSWHKIYTIEVYWKNFRININSKWIMKSEKRSLSTHEVQR